MWKKARLHSTHTALSSIILFNHKQRLFCLFIAFAACLAMAHKLNQSEWNGVTHGNLTMINLRNVKDEWSWRQRNGAIHRHHNDDGEFLNWVAIWSGRRMRTSYCVSMYAPQDKYKFDSFRLLAHNLDFHIANIISYPPAAAWEGFNE